MPMKLGATIPSLDGATRWYNGEVPHEELFGAPLLIHFWAVSCYICKENLPQLQELKTKYPQLSFLAVHMPRQEEDTDIAAVEALIKDLKITEPCAVDNDHTLKTAFGNDEAWVPAYFLFDSEGKLKLRSAGANGLSMIKGALERMFPVSNTADNNA
jgi:thiol-disulfide isomerase/thioredoxin